MAAPGATLQLPVRYYRTMPRETSGYVDYHLTLPLGQTALLLCDVFGAAFDDDTELTANSRLHQDVVLAGSLDHAERHRDIVRNRIVPLADAARKARLPVIYTENHYAPIAH